MADGGGGPVIGGDEAAAAAQLADAWGRDWAAARYHLLTLLAAGGRGEVAVRLAEAAMPGEQIGWRCPGCGRCYSPAVAECPYCRPPAGDAGIDPQTAKVVGDELKKRYVRGPVGRANNIRLAGDRPCGG